MSVERVRYLREKHDLTQKEMGNLLGVNNSTYAGWERGRDTFPLERLIILVNYFNTSIDYILGLTEQPNYKDLQKDINVKLMQERIKIIRKKNNYTQTNMAKIMNTSHSTICAYELGKVTPSLIYIYQLSQMFNVSMDFLLGRTNQQKLKELEPI